jgi:hypothetical protein
MTHPADAPSDAVQARESAERLLGDGEPVLAYGVVVGARARWPNDRRLRQLEGLALARSGDTAEANRVLGALVDDGADDPETLGLLARTHKDMALDATDERRGHHLDAAATLYRRAWERARGSEAVEEACYAGIDAAATAVLRDDLEVARKIAADVVDLCATRRRGVDGGMPEYWLEATLGEAALILGDEFEAELHYAAAAGLAGGNYGHLASMRRQSRLLVEHLRGDRAWIDEVLRTPPVLVFAGHMIDAADRDAPRFPASLAPRVEAVLREDLARLRPLAAYGSAACGGDLIVLETVRTYGGETHVVLPFPPEEFRRTSVEFAGGDWAARFDAALAAADSVTITSDHRARDSLATFEYANLVLTGLGRLRAQRLEASVHGLAVWDPATPRIPGGTASTVALWERSGLEVRHVHLPDLAAREPASAPTPGTAGPARPAAWVPTTTAAPAPAAVRAAPRARHEMRAMLFADAVGVGQLTEDQVPSFVDGFFGMVAALIDRTSHRPEHVETSGDDLYMVFETTRDAARFALDLSALIDRCDREALGLPTGFTLRIALHCGPVYCGRNPITRAPIYTGLHTSRAARIEPITPPGQVYASAAFAAVAAAIGVDDVAMRYVGRIPLANDHGTVPMYHVRPRR